VSISDHVTNTYLIHPNTLRQLAGLPLAEVDLLSQIDEDDFFQNVAGEMLSVEIMTLYQKRYEMAFEILSGQEGFKDMPLEEISHHVENLLPQYDYVVPHILVEEGVILVVVDCERIDTHTVNMASKLLSCLPSTEPGYYWEYMNKEK